MCHASFLAADTRPCVLIDAYVWLGTEENWLDLCPISIPTLATPLTGDLEITGQTYMYVYLFHNHVSIGELGDSTHVSVY